MDLSYLLPHLIFLYGSFLIICGIVAVVFIGLKAKTALISGGTSGAILILISYLAFIELPIAPYLGMFVNFALLIVFSWRATKTLFSVFNMLKTGEGDVNGKGIAFLIISLMATISMIVFAAQILIYMSIR